MATATKKVRRRTRLARGPLTIGEPAGVVEPRLGTAGLYRPDTVADGGDAFGLTVRAASVRGLYKRYVGGPRQDDVCLRLHPVTRTLIVAVADGVSAAVNSDVAAALAVRYAAAAVARQLDAGGELDFEEVFRHAAWALVDEHRRTEGDPRAGLGEAAASLATTLTVAAIRAGEPDDLPLQVQIAAVGDSPAFVLTDRQFHCVGGSPAPQDGLLGGGVHALPRDMAPATEATRTLAQDQVLLICTDGLALPLAGGGGEVGQTLARELSRTPDIVDFARLLDFSRATYDDDRTLVAVWPRRRE
jgi:serine/threonine protein phosphatase PrpC